MPRDLKPCPFCGGKPAFDSIPGGGHFIECRSCRASTNLRYASGDDPAPLLAEQWNRRAQPAVVSMSRDEREKLHVERDAEICGIGFLVDGVRVSPERVQVLNAPMRQAESARLSDWCQAAGCMHETHGSPVVPANRPFNTIPSQQEATQPKLVEGLAPTHRCKVCRSLWRQCDDGTWNLRSQLCGSCCDNPVGKMPVEPLYQHPPKDAQEQRRSSRQMALGAAIEQACSDLPDGYVIELHLERGYGGAHMVDPHGNRLDLDMNDRDLAVEIHVGISTARNKGGEA